MSDQPIQRMFVAGSHQRASDRARKRASSKACLFGASLKDLGKKCFCAMKVEGADIAALKALT